jgi:hypothetical protein
MMHRQYRWQLKAVFGPSCHYRGPPVTTLAPASPHHVVISLAALRLAASCLIAVEKELNLIVFLVFFLRYFVQNVRV